METITALLKAGRRAHLIGIGGISMSALAEILSKQGVIVTGSDRLDSETISRLREQGILVEVGESGLYLPGADIAIRTAAAREDNPEVRAARGMGLALIERSEAFGELMRDFEKSVCVSGTHGKTTTTGMLAYITKEQNPTVMMGGSLPLYGNACHKIGENELMIAEACEYHNSYHNFFPTTAVILNIDVDHLDFFSGLSETVKSFRTFAKLVPEEGVIVANGEDENVRAALSGIERKVVWFGKGCQIQANNVTHERAKFSFTVTVEGRPYAQIRLKVMGMHNVHNALAAAAAAWANGLPGEVVEEGLREFPGAGRRLEFLGKLNEAEVYNDYAHHPRAVKVTLETLRLMEPQRLVCVFQPHTFTRAKAFVEEFVKELSAADKVYLTDIYASRENDPGDISSKLLAERITGAIYAESFEELIGLVKEDTRKGDIIVVMGAGDITEVARGLVE